VERCAASIPCGVSALLTVIATQSIFVPYRTIRKGGALIGDRQDSRAQQTRERIRAAARQLFLQQGYQATSMDAIRLMAGVSSKETLYRHYASKEELFVDVMGHLTMEQPGFFATIAALPEPHDLPALHQALTTLAREILTLMTQPEYLPLLRILIAETARFPQLGSMFFATVPQRGLGIIMGLLGVAREYGVIGDADFEVTARTLLGGLLTYVAQGLLAAGAESQPQLDRADAVVAVILRGLKP
jgi:TetR/AcrR family transcriptional regulator, mexJK operon transcriptional repressor